MTSMTTSQRGTAIVAAPTRIADRRLIGSLQMAFSCLLRVIGSEYQVTQSNTSLFEVIEAPREVATGAATLT